jgi:glycosyltransferase involved in cell wall biosynthesis
MRWRALRDALSIDTDCRVVEIECDRWRECCDTCIVTGGDPRDKSRATWYFASAYCGDHAGQIARRLISSAVTTVVCSGLETHLYVSSLSRFPELRVIYDMHNVESPLFDAISVDSGVPDPDLGLIKEAESLAVSTANDIWTCSDDDACLLSSIYPDISPEHIYVVPNVVPVGAAPLLPSVTPRRVCFTGHLWWYPNIVAVRLLAETITPLLRRRGFRAPVVVGGREPSRDVIKLCQAADIELIVNPDSTRDLIADSIMAVPLTLGGGTRLKALEAFALGAPLVSTSKGVEGLKIRPEFHYLKAELAEEFVSAIIRLTHEPDLRDQVVTQAWRAVRDHYSVSTLRVALAKALGWS